MGYWLHLKQTGLDTADCYRLKEEMKLRFATIDRDTLLQRVAANKWDGNRRTYTAMFGRVVAQGSQLSGEDMVSCFLHNLPKDLRWAVTQRGAVKYRSWREAAASLAAIAIPWKAAGEEYERLEREMQQSLQGTAAGGRRPPMTAENRIYQQTIGDTTGGMCFQCKGRGHRARNCPTGQQGMRRQGETCMRCGGLGHYAKDCATHGLTRVEPRERTERQTTSPNAERIERLNGRA